MVVCRYEDEEYAGDGCYHGQHCHHEHCWDDVTVCICSQPECNDWTPDVCSLYKLYRVMFYKDYKIYEVCRVYKVFSKQGNVSTPVPVTDGSGILCWVGEGDDLEASQCFHNQNMCGYLLVSNTSSLLRELVSTTFTHVCHV